MTAEAKVVKLSADRWQALVSWYVAPPYIDATIPVIEIEVIEPVAINDVLYLPALYREA